jgi:hypothetical protein
VVIIEYQTAYPSDVAFVTEYRADFKANRDFRHGASLLALRDLGRGKGYRLVGCQRYCFNAIFVRDDIPTAGLPEVSVASCLQHPKAAAMLAPGAPGLPDW